ncbi:hypothetical protein [Geoglobus acetivorans]|uniref:hypothetical protein n=1 Tax=Geoglobus acetivorans TaxID=565033 RepID=UPI00064ED5A9
MINETLIFNTTLNNTVMNFSMLLNDPNVVVTTWTMLNKFAAFCFSLGMVVGYGIAYLKFAKTSKS